jgi:hypothetical protein
MDASQPHAFNSDKANYAMTIPFNPFACCVNFGISSSEGEVVFSGDLSWIAFQMLQLNQPP